MQRPLHREPVFLRPLHEDGSNLLVTASPHRMDGVGERAVYPAEDVNKTREVRLALLS